MEAGSHKLSDPPGQPKNEVVFIVDDDSASRSAIARMVRTAGFCEANYASASEFLEKYDGAQPGCLILDIRMPGMTGLELQRTLIEQGHSIPIIFITAFGDVPVITQAIRNGAVDVLPKPFDAEVLLSRIGEALRLDQANRLKQEQVERIRRCIESLTEREREVMKHLAAGNSAKEIAQSLEISPKTVDNHRAKVLEKMQVDNPTQLARKLALVETHGVRLGEEVSAGMPPRNATPPNANDAL